MLRIIFFLLISSFPFLGLSQGLTGNQLLQNAISYHDPNNNWPTFNGEFMVTMETPKKSERKSKVKINLPEQVFSLTVNQEEVSLKYILKGNDCKLRLNGAAEFSETQQKTFNLNCDRAVMMKNYYT